MRLIGWRYPLKDSLEVLADRTKCYPISAINMKQHTLKKLLKHKYITVQDIPTDPDELVKIVGLSPTNAKRIVKEARDACK